MCIQRRKSYHYGIKYKRDAIGNLLSTVISLADLIRGLVGNMSTDWFKIMDRFTCRWRCSVAKMITCVMKEMAV